MGTMRSTARKQLPVAASGDRVEHEVQGADDQVRDGEGGGVATEGAAARRSTR